ncbi:MAG: SulP family inorganic anion transporter [Verrucomicrobia bacterium]|nr:SulP family inorganic anion transporter [Verrucomicrobiota bacterium]
MGDSLSKDFAAGVVVFLVALPLCLGIALASGAPLLSGLIAGIVGGIVVGIASGSHLSVTGPAAGLTSIVLMSIGKLGTFEAFLLAVVLAGVIQLAMGALKMGNVVNYFPSSVIRGMLVGIGIIIILKQIPHAFGYDKVPEGDDRFIQPSDSENSFSEIAKHLDLITPGALFVALAGLAILIFWEKTKVKQLKVVPGALVAVLAGIGLNALFKVAMPSWAITEAEHLVQVPVPENFAGWLKAFSQPLWSSISNGQVWVVAATLAIVASIETLLCLEAVDKLDPQKRHSPANRELFAQGLGNIVSGLLGGLPITSVIVRSGANVNAGARTKLSAIIHGILLLFCVLLIPKLLNLIPLSSLAAILLITGWKLANPKTFKQMWNAGWTQFLPFIVTILTMVFTDLLKGVVVGLIFTIVFLLWENLKHALRRPVHEGDHELLELGPHVTFLHKANVLKELGGMPKGTHIVVDATKSYYVDPDVVEALQDFRVHRAKDKGLTLEFVGKIFDAPAAPSAH